MNYLAHFYLAFDNPDWLLGQFMGDYVKGKKYLDYPLSIQQGILLHRFIDYTTDHSPSTDRLRALLRPELGRYTGIAMDVYFDHFLAANWNSYHNLPLEDFIQWSYKHLWELSSQMNNEMKTTLSYMMKYNWLKRYIRIEGIERTLLEIYRRFPIGNSLGKAPETFRNQYSQIETAFFGFFPQLIAESKAKLDTFAARE